LNEALILQHVIAGYPR